MCRKKQNLYLDKRSDFQEIENSIIKKGYLPHIGHREERVVITKHFYHKHSRRWVVERTNSWHNRFGKLLVTCEKKIENYFVLVCLGCCIIIYRRIILDRLSRLVPQNTIITIISRQETSSSKAEICPSFTLHILLKIVTQ